MKNNLRELQIREVARILEIPYTNRVNTLKQIKDTVDTSINSLREGALLILADRAIKTGNSTLFLYAEAMLHQKLGIKPKTEKLGYRLARSNKKVFNNEEEKELFIEISCNFDLTEYVFNTTHYDEAYLSNHELGKGEICDEYGFMRRS